MSTTTSLKFLVTGASGNFGQLVLGFLTGHFGIAPENIIATSRKVENLSEWAEKGVITRAANYDEPESLAAAFAGADRLLLISTDSLGTGQRLTQHTNAVDAAKAAGVGQLLYTSMPNAETSHVLFAPDHAGTEAAIKASGLPFTILRNNWYSENLFLALPGALAGGSWYTASEQGKTAYISRVDLAFAAAAALVKGGELAGKTLTLTGTEGVTVDEIASQVAAGLGKPLNVVHVPVSAIIAGLESHGFPQPIAEILASFDTATAAGDLSIVTNDFEGLTGSKPQPFGDWLTANLDALR